MNTDETPLGDRFTHPDDLALSSGCQRKFLFVKNVGKEAITPGGLCETTDFDKKQYHVRACPRMMGVSAQHGIAGGLPPHCKPIAPGECGYVQVQGSMGLIYGN